MTTIDFQYHPWLWISRPKLLLLPLILAWLNICMVRVIHKISFLTAILLSKGPSVIYSTFIRWRLTQKNKVTITSIRSSSWASSDGEDNTTVLQQKRLSVWQSTSPKTHAIPYQATSTHHKWHWSILVSTFAIFFFDGPHRAADGPDLQAILLCIVSGLTGVDDQNRWPFADHEAPAGGIRKTERLERGPLATPRKNSDFVSGRVASDAKFRIVIEAGIQSCHTW